eukprot:359636-Chlamydomonas_euryale.AAC.2
MGYGGGRGGGKGNMGGLGHAQGPRLMHAGLMHAIPMHSRAIHAGLMHEGPMPAGPMHVRNMHAGPMHARTAHAGPMHAASMHERDSLRCSKLRCGKPAIYIWGYPLQGLPCTKHACLGLRFRPIMPASASAGPRPRTCMHANASRPKADACMSSSSGRPRPRHA